jgi:NAD(P)-dependent dehydrogenase (short-subunit alcohol dehydrogenase family)
MTFFQQYLGATTFFVDLVKGATAKHNLLLLTVPTDRYAIVQPTWIELQSGSRSGEEGRRICEAFTALGRAGATDDLVGVYQFLACDASRYLTGQALKIDGGWSCGPTPQLLERVIGSSHVS